MQAESKGRLYRHIAGDLDFPAASKTQFRADTLTTTSIALCPPYVYTVSKDITLIKWALANPPLPSKKRKPPKKLPPPQRRRPVKICYTRGNKKNSNDPSFKHHTGHILAVAASSSGKFVATGGLDKRLIIWSATDLTPLRVFTQHRDAVTSLAFRRGTHQLYSSSKDRTVKTWSLDELAYVETLFGHQDEVVDLAALSQERCVSVGGRDRTARLWKVAEETQLVFRGGGGGGRNLDEKNRRSQGLKDTHSSAIPPRGYVEGSIDRVALIDEETFITGSDNGALSLWTLHKKKPVFTVALAHGLDPPILPEEASAEEVPDPKVPGVPQPRWITALATVPYSDLILSGSWDGWVRVWKVSADKKRIERVGVLGAGDEDEELDAVLPKVEVVEEDGSVRGVVNDIELFVRGEGGKDGVCVVVATGTEHRLGRWKHIEGKNGAVVFEVPRATVSTVAKDEVQTEGGGESKGAGQGENV
jgi:ribosomal RNA-processing protein 9